MEGVLSFKERNNVSAACSHYLVIITVITSAEACSVVEAIFGVIVMIKTGLII